MKEKNRVMAIDYGEARIGLAVSDPLGLTAQPAGMVERHGKRKDTEAILKIAREKEVGLIVMGLPLTLKGHEGGIANQARKLARALETVGGLPVEFLDERFSTAEAERVLLEADSSRAKRKQVIDQMAAQIILQKYLDALSGQAGA